MNAGHCEVLKRVREMKKAPQSWVVVGDEVQLINEARAAARNIAKDAAAERTDFAALVEQPSIGGASLFGGSRLLEVVDYGKPAAEAHEVLLKLVSRPPDADSVVIAVYGLERKQVSQKGKLLAWLGALQKHAPVVSAMRLNAAATAEWCRHWLPEISSEAAAMVGAKTEGNLGAAKQAIMKMSIGGGTEAADAAKALSDGGRYTVFDVADNAVCHRGGKALEILARLFADNTPAPLILWSLGNAAQQLLSVKRGDMRGIWGQERVKGMRKIASNSTEEQLVELVRRAARADRVIKGAVYKSVDDKGASERDVKIALTNLVVDIAAAGRNKNVPLPGRAGLGDD